jgi:hypothetical protein
MMIEKYIELSPHERLETSHDNSFEVLTTFLTRVGIVAPN